MLTNSLRIIDTTKKQFLELIFLQSDQKIWKKLCCGDLSSVSDSLTCCLSISFVTRGFLGISVIQLFAVYNFRKKNLLSWSSFSKCSKFYVDFGHAEKNPENVFWFSDNCIPIGSVRHSLLLRGNFCHRVSIC